MDLCFLGMVAMVVKVALVQLVGVVWCIVILAVGVTWCALNGVVFKNFTCNVMLLMQLQF